MVKKEFENKRVLKKLNVGCGKDIKEVNEGWINLDSHGENGADIIFDLSKIDKGKKMPFKENSIDYIYCSHVLEDFTDPVPIIDELIRILKKEGTLEIRVPHETTAWSNVYHKRAFNLTSLGALTGGDYGKKRPITLKSRFYGNYGIGSKIIAGILNWIPLFIFYGSPIKYFFPSTNIKFIIEKTE